VILTWLGYVVAALCIGTYIYAASGRSLTPNLWANMLGGPVVAFGNALVGYWPAVILEVFFTLAGAYGLVRRWYNQPWWNAYRKHPTRVVDALMGARGVRRRKTACGTASDEGSTPSASTIARPGNYVVVREARGKEQEPPW